MQIAQVRRPISPQDEQKWDIRRGSKHNSSDTMGDEGGAPFGLTWWGGRQN